MEIKKLRVFSNFVTEVIPGLLVSIATVTILVALGVVEPWPGLNMQWVIPALLTAILAVLVYLVTIFERLFLLFQFDFHNKYAAAITKVINERNET